MTSAVVERAGAAAADERARHGTIVIGGGITGLSAAWALLQANEDVLLLEAADDAGGVISSVRDGAYLAEEGPNTVVSTPALERLIREFDLEGELMPADPLAVRRFIVRDGVPHAVPASPLGLVRSPLLSSRGKLRLLAEPFLPARRDGAEESLAGFTRRRFGGELLDRVLAPVLSGVFAGDPERISVRRAVPILERLEQRHRSVLVGAVRELPKLMRAKRLAREADGAPRRTAPLSFREGLATLPRVMSRVLGRRVRTRTRVTALSRGVDGWEVETLGPAGARTLEARRVVLAIPAHAYARLALPDDVAAEARAIAAVPHAPVATLSLAYRRADVAHPLDGFGALVPAVEGRQVVGILFPSSLAAGRVPEGEVLLTCFLGGALRPELAALDERAAVEAAGRDLRDLLGVSGAPRWVRLRRFAEGIPQYTAAQGAAVAAAERIESLGDGLALAGSWRTGLSVGACAEAGLQAAARLLAGARRPG